MKYVLRKAGETLLFVIYPPLWSHLTPCKSSTVFRDISFHNSLENIYKEPRKKSS